MFRTQNNVPEVYVSQSRDFQLLCRLIDCIQGDEKFNIDMITECLSPLHIPDNFLELLCTRVGFFPRQHYDNNVLRYVVAAFPYIIKNKGSEQGIKSAVNAILKAENDPQAVEAVYIDINNTTHTIAIYTKNEIYNKNILDDVLSYILPFGYTYFLGVYSEATYNDKITVTENVQAKIYDNSSAVSMLFKGSDVSTDLNSEDNTDNEEDSTDNEDSTTTDITDNDLHTIGNTVIEPFIDTSTDSNGETGENKE